MLPSYANTNPTIWKSKGEMFHILPSKIWQKANIVFLLLKGLLIKARDVKGEKKKSW